MHPFVQSLIQDFSFDGGVAQTVPRFLAFHDRPKVAEHCAAVAAEAMRIARTVQADLQAAETAGWLHDISAVIPPGERLAAAHLLGLEVLPEETAAPVLIHQKLSALIAEEVFGVQEKLVLEAIGCHTTLRAGATQLDKILFVADKLAWDQAGEAPYARAMRAALEKSLEHAAWVYLDDLWQRRSTLPAVHPWMIAAHQELLALIS